MKSQESSTDAQSSNAIVRPARPDDADEIARIYIESAEHHANLDPARYAVPSVVEIEARYRDGRQIHGDAVAITLIAEREGEILGFVDARLDRSPDPMHRNLLYCVIVEIAVSRRHQSRGIGERLLFAAEAWGREHGADFASLEYLAGNTRAGDFYQNRMDYRPAHITAIKRL